jgi:hypothetical protein
LTALTAPLHVQVVHQGFAELLTPLAVTEIRFSLGYGVAAVSPGTPELGMASSALATSNASSRARARRDPNDYSGRLLAQNCRGARTRAGRRAGRGRAGGAGPAGPSPTNASLAIRQHTMRSDETMYPMPRQRPEPAIHRRFWSRHSLDVHCLRRGTRAARRGADTHTG